MHMHNMSEVLFGAPMHVLACRKRGLKARVTRVISNTFVLLYICVVHFAQCTECCLWSCLKAKPNLCMHTRNA